MLSRPLVAPGRTVLFAPRRISYHLPLLPLLLPLGACLSRDLLLLRLKVMMSGHLRQKTQVARTVPINASLLKVTAPLPQPQITALARMSVFTPSMKITLSLRLPER